MLRAPVHSPSLTRSTRRPVSVFEAMLSGPAGHRAQVRFADGSLRWLPIERFVAPADPVDRYALRGLCGPVLDIGCGPGRALRALADLGVSSLGVDISPLAVALARRAGASAIVASVFDELPLAGRWGSALLLDGNIGIGGDAVTLLRRVRELLAPSAAVVVELVSPQARSTQTKIRLETPYDVSGWFRWAEVSAADADGIADAAQLTITARWSHRDRWFTTMRRPA